MLYEKTLKHHASLVDQMAGTIGLDLEEAILAGQLQIDTLGDAVLGCTGCSNPEGCAQWMAAQDVPADAPPSICRNTDLFGLLKAGKRA